MREVERKSREERKFHPPSIVYFCVHKSPLLGWVSSLSLLHNKQRNPYHKHVAFDKSSPLQFEQSLSTGVKFCHPPRVAVVLLLLARVVVGALIEIASRDFVWTARPCRSGLSHAIVVHTTISQPCRRSIFLVLVLFYKRREIDVSLAKKSRVSSVDLSDFEKGKFESRRESRSCRNCGA